MRPADVICNQAISAAISAYKNGIGAIRSLKIREPVTLEHNPSNTDMVAVK